MSRWSTTAETFAAERQASEEADDISTPDSSATGYLASETVTIPSPQP